MISVRDVCDIPKLSVFFESIHESTGISCALLDATGEILFTSGWNDICRNFYGTLEDAHKSCHIRALCNSANQIDDIPRYTTPQGLSYAASPIIIEGERICTLLMGQVFLEDPDYDFFRQEAKKYGFDETAFLKAVKQVPKLPAEQFEREFKLFINLANILADQGMARLRAQKSEAVAIECLKRKEADIRMHEAAIQPVTAGGYASCNQILDAALEEALLLTDSPIGYICIYDEATSIFTFHSWTAPCFAGCNVKEKPFVFGLEEAGLWGEAVRQRKAVITNDYQAPNPLKRGCPPGHFAIRRHMNTPVFRNSGIVGVAGVGNKTADYTEADVECLTIFMDGVWNILEKIQAEEELKTAKEMAEASDRFKSNLLANLSHELRTPLNGIIGASQLLAMTDLSGEQQAYLDMISISADNELTIVNNMIELARMEAEEIHLDSRPYSLLKCMDECLEAHMATIKAKGLELVKNYSQNFPNLLKGDPQRVSLMLHCLLGNAVKFTDSGAITVSLSTAEDRNGGIKARVSIMDTGAGIEKEKLESIFQLFVQGDMSAIRRHGGLGIGLSICHRLSKAMGGCVKVDSLYGDGSCFTLELPVEELDNSADSQIIDKSLKILVAEDDYFNSIVIVSMLGKLGHRVITAPNGQEAVNVFSKCPFDLVLMDLQMPVMNGVEAFQQIRRLEMESGMPPTPVVAITAFGRPAIGAYDYTTDFLSILSKPIKLDDLIEVIGRCSK